MRLSRELTPIKLVGAGMMSERSILHRLGGDRGIDKCKLGVRRACRDPRLESIEARRRMIHLKEGSVDTTTLLIIIVIFLLVGGGGWYGRGRWY
jgi:hypothetical protein